MKNFNKIFLLMLLLMSSYNISFSQVVAPQTNSYTTTGTTTSNIFPLASTSNNRVQWLYKPTDFATTPQAGTISAIYIKTADAITVNKTFTNFKVKLGTTTATAISTAFIDPLTTVVEAPTYTITPTIAAQGWIKINLTTPFVWNGTSNFILEISQTAYTSGFNLSQGAPEANRRIWGNVTTSLVPVGTNDALVQFGYDMIFGCMPPTTITSSNLTASTAMISWTHIGLPATTWNIKYGPTGFNVNTAGTLVTTATNPYTITGLNAQTTYDYYIRSNCDSNSNWSTVRSFTTTCIQPSLPSINDTGICGPGNITLQVPSVVNNTVKWYTNNTIATPLQTGNSYTTPNLTTAVTYYVSNTNNLNCESSRKPVVVSVYALPIVNLGNDSTICPNDTISLTTTNTFSKYLWNTNDTTMVKKITQAGTYSILIQDVNKCTGKDTIVISNGIVPVNIINANYNLCQDSFVNLNAGNLGSTYTWNTGATTSQITVTNPGNYNVIIKSVNKCKITSNTVLLAKDTPVLNLPTALEICFTDTVTLDATNVNSQYFWNTNEQTPTINVNTPGIYSVLVVNEFGCQASGATIINHLPIPSANGFNFIPYFDASQPNTMQISFVPENVINTNTISWDFGDGSPMVTDPNPTHIYNTSGQYEVTMLLSNDCGTKEYKILVQVDLATGLASIIDRDIKINAYPNPANQSITLQTSDNELIIKSYKVIDITGKTVLSKNNISNSKHTLNVQELANGVYQIVMQTNKGIAHVKIIVSK